jgi:imidazoleglycerol-phosphate dehydratase
MEVDDGRRQFSIASSGVILAEAEVLNIDLCTKVRSQIGTGICFLDHMIDQFTSHGMLGVTLRCGIADVQDSSKLDSVDDAPMKKRKTFSPLSDYATGMCGRPHDRDIFITCGTALGLALRRVVEDAVARATAAETTAIGDAASGSSGSSRSWALFCSPLDEAFAEASLDLQPPQERCGRCVTSLEPYGKFAGSTSGRTWIGRYRTELTPVFWSSLATAMRCDLSLRKVRGGNAHHQLESTFKSFARAFRAALDRIADGGSHGCAEPCAGPMPPAAVAEEPRRAERKRATKETTIEVRVNLDAPWSLADEPTGFLSAWTGKVMTATNMRATFQSTSRIVSGIEVLDRVLIEFAKAAGIEIIIHCEGDRHIDDHHTAEDIAITLGQCFYEALGDKAGLARMGCAEGAHGGARVRAVLDLSNRPHFESDLPLDEEYVGAAAAEVAIDPNPSGTVGSPSPWDTLCGAVLSCEMLYHILNSLTLEMRSTCHLELVEDTGATGHTLDLALAAASAYGAAFSRAIRVDPRRGGTVASSKGTLSK